MATQDQLPTYRVCRVACRGGVLGEGGLGGAGHGGAHRCRRLEGGDHGEGHHEGERLRTKRRGGGRVGWGGEGVSLCGVWVSSRLGGVGKVSLDGVGKG